MSESPTHRVKKKKKSKKSKKRKKRELEEQEPEQEHEPDQEQPIKKQKIEVDQKAPDNLLSTINVLKDRFISLIDETHDPLNIPALYELLNECQKTPVNKLSLQESKLGIFINDWRKEKKLIGHPDHHELVRRCEQTLLAWKRQIFQERTMNY